MPIRNVAKPGISAMNRTAVYIVTCMAVALFAFADRARAACDPPRDISSCLSVPNARISQANAPLPQRPFVVTYPDTRSTLAVTDSESAAKTPEPAPGNANCNAQNMSKCATVPLSGLTDSAVTRHKAPFRVLLPDGRSLIAFPMSGP
jgi:hypothetical protein